MPKIICWDLETSSLNANGGFIICASLVDADNPNKIYRSYRIDDYKGWKQDPWHDKHLVLDLSRELSTADVWITYYGKRFDAPFLTTRIFYWRNRGAGIPLLANVPHIDLYDTAKRKLKLHSNRLQVVSTLLGNGNKTPLELPVWLKAAGGHRKSIDYVDKHCQEDAKILARNYIILRPLIPAHPHMGLLNGEKLSCAACGSPDVQKRGVYVTEATRRQRLWCKKCGRWSSMPSRSEESRNTVERKPADTKKKNNKRGRIGVRYTRASATSH